MPIGELDRGEMGQVREGLGSTQLEPYFAALETWPAWKWVGRVVEANGQTVES